MELNKLQYFAQTVFSKLGVNNNLVQVAPMNNNCVAMALGITTDMTLPGLQPGKTVLGVINVD
jgi:hypothetical protein